MRPITLDELGRRWPTAAVLWDRDHAELLDPRFEVDGDTLFASDRTCPGHQMGFALREGCRCLAWEGTPDVGRWVPAARSLAVRVRWLQWLGRTEIRASDQELVAWCEYYVRTDLHDRGVCAARHAEHGELPVERERREAVPVLPEEIRRSRAFARDLRRHLFGRYSGGHSAAQPKVSDWTHDQRVAYLERAGRWPLPRWPPDLRWTPAPPDW